MQRGDINNFVYSEKRIIYEYVVLIVTVKMRDAIHLKNQAIFIILLICSIPVVMAQQNSVPEQIVDTEAPELRYFTIYPTATAMEAVEFSYEVYDYGNNGDSSKCSGVQKVEFKNKYSGQIVATRAGEQGDCVMQETFDYSPTDAGEQTICATAIDYAGIQSEQKCAGLNVVWHVPDVEKVEFFDANGEVSFVGSKATTLGLKLFFSDAELVDTVLTRVNVEKLTGVSDDWRNVYKSDSNTLLVENIDVKPDFSCKIIAAITDIFGNSAEKEIQCALAVDTTAPIPTAIKTELQDIEGAYLVSNKANAKITAIIDEQGIGFARQKNVYLDLSQLGGRTRVQADVCEEINHWWECEWDVIAAAKKGGYTITLLDDSEDDLGNKFAKGLKQEIDVTDNVLKILDTQYAPEFPTEADEFMIMVSIPADVAKPKVTIDASEITRNKQKNINAECEKDANALRCTALIKNLVAVDAGKKVTITVIDAQGFVQRAEKDIQIFETEPKIKDFFSFGGVTIRPINGIDRRTATVTEYPIFASVRWTPKPDARNVQILSQSVNCDDKYLTTTPEVINAASKRPVIFFKTTTDVSDIGADLLKIDCSASLIIKKDKVVFKRPETKAFTLKIPIYNSPLGSISETVEKKLKQIEQEINDFDGEIKKLENVNSALGKIVGIGQMIIQIATIMSHLLIFVLAVLVELDFLPGDIVDKAWNNFCVPYSRFMAFTRGGWALGSLADSVASASDIDAYGLFKTTAFLYTCQLCRHTDAIFFPFAGAVGDIKTWINGKEGRPTTVDVTLLKEWEPKKSIHVAQNCYCPNAIEYNLRKERQLKCIYRSCIKEHAKKGLQYTNCDRTYKEQNCLYVEGAAWKLAGGAALAWLISNSVMQIINSFPTTKYSDDWNDMCSPTMNQDWCTSVAAGEAGARCSAESAMQLLSETDFFRGNRFNWDRYDGEIEGNDYCAQDE